MISFMGLWMKRSLWSNFCDFFIQRFQIMCASWRKRSMVSSKLHMTSLIDSHNLYSVLVSLNLMLMTGTSLQFIHYLIRCMICDFTMKDLVSLHYFLGIKVDCESDASNFYLSQTKYIVDFLLCCKMDGATPMTFSSKWSQRSGDPLSDPTEYRSIVGALQYCTLTQPKNQLRC